MVELALTIPVLLLLLVGMVEVGNGLNAYMTVVDAARDGARLGSKGYGSDSDITNLVIKDMGRLPNAATSTVTVTRNVLLGPSPPSQPGIQVTVCYNHSPILRVPMVMPNPLRMCSTTVMPKLS